MAFACGAGLRRSTEAKAAALCPGRLAFVLPIGHALCEKMTPLMHAVMGCDEERIIYLVDHGADVTARNAIGVTPLHMASCGPRPRIIQSLVSGGANINAQDNDGLTPLMSTMGYPDNTELIIEAGADVNLTDKKGRTALDHAMKIDTFRKEILKILRDAGAVSGRSVPSARRK